MINQQKSINKKIRPEFIDRVKNPKNYPFIKNSNGQISTHRMRAERDAEGNWYAFPTIVQLPDGSLKEFPDTEQGTQEAMSYNIENENYVAFGKQKEKALNYSKGGYKKGTPLEGQEAGKLLLNEEEIKNAEARKKAFAKIKKGLD